MLYALGMFEHRPRLMPLQARDSKFDFTYVRVHRVRLDLRHEVAEALAGLVGRAAQLAVRAVAVVRALWQSARPATQ